MSGTEKRDLVGSDARIAREPSQLESYTNTGFYSVCLIFGGFVVALLIWIVVQIGWTARPAVRELGVNFVASSTWDPQKSEFGILPEIWGTLYSSILALCIAGVFGVAIAIYLTQGFLSRPFELVFKNIIDLLAAIPSVVYGLWGIFFVISAFRPMADWLHENLGFLPIFGTKLIGPGMLPAAFVLAIMILPTVTAVARDALEAVPNKLREAAFGLGATRWEVILRVTLPTAGSGVFGALVLGLGRALGETMALAMLVGSSNRLSVSLFSPGNTLAALLANSFPEASGLEVGALMYAALVLMMITLLVNIAGTAIMRGTLRKLEGKR